MSVLTVVLTSTRYTSTEYRSVLTWYLVLRRCTCIYTFQIGGRYVLQVVLQPLNGGRGSSVSDPRTLYWIKPRKSDPCIIWELMCVFEPFLRIHFFFNSSVKLDLR